MTKLHEEILELAAASIDFPLTTEEADQVAAHLRGCPSCRGRVEAISSDQRAIAALQPIAIDGAHATAIWTGVRRRRTPAPPLVRVVLLAAALALLALAAAAVGGALLRDAGPRLGISGPSTDQAAVIVPSSSPVPTAATPGSFAEGAFVDVAVTGLRFRTAPTVDNAKSAKLEPLLGVGTHLKVLNGPVQADGYAWYEVQALDLPHHGWVAAADHDGEPWILNAAGADPTPSFSPVEEGSRGRCVRIRWSTACRAAARSRRVRLSGSTAESAARSRRRSAPTSSTMPATRRGPISRGLRRTT